MSEPYTYPLKHPLELKSADGKVVEKIERLELVRLKGRDLKAAEAASGMGLMAALLARSARVPPSTVDEMDAEDVMAAGQVVMGFIGGSLPTGGT